MSETEEKSYPVLYPQVDLKEWCERYDIELTEDPCVKCGQVYPFTTPIALKDWRGVTQDIHDCGPVYRQYILRPIGQEEKNWEKFCWGKSE